MIVVRPGRYAGTINAGPEGLRLVVVEYPPAAMRRLGTISVGLATSRTFMGRSSVELAWRAPAEMEAGHPARVRTARVSPAGRGNPNLSAEIPADKRWYRLTSHPSERTTEPCAGPSGRRKAGPMSVRSL